MFAITDNMVYAYFDTYINEGFENFRNVWED